MTDYNSSDIFVEEVLGYYSPSTFTIKTSFKPDLTHFPEVHFDLTEANIRGFSNFVHEITHYLQYAGTIFGLKYQLASRLELMTFARLLRDCCSRNFYALPFIGQRSLESFSQNDLRDIAKSAYLRQQLNHLIAGSPQRRAWSKNIPVSNLPDPGLFVADANDHYPLAGLVAMENWATWNQHLLVASPYVPPAVRTILQDEYMRHRFPDYTIVNHTLDRRGHDYLAPTIYWIAFNPPLKPHNESPTWLADRLKALVEAAIQMPKHSMSAFLEKADDIEAQLCDATGFARPLACVKSAIEEIELNGAGIADCPEIRISLDVLRWVASRKSIFSFLWWPATASILEKEFSLTPFLGFPIWQIEYEGCPPNERWGHFVHNYPTEFFGAFEQMRLWRSLLPELAWGLSDKKRICCPVPRLRTCSSSCEWCSSLFCGSLPGRIDKSSCFLGLSFEKHLGIDMAKLFWTERSE